MKPILKIQNIGPIKDVALEINKVNLFIGPQSSGKSTLAKLISFCQWMEKDIVMHQGIGHIDFGYFRTNFKAYHKLNFSLNDNSYIEYKSDNILFKFKTCGDFDIKILSDLSKIKVGKITYVPSERNYVAIPHISTLTMEDNYVRGYIFDWLRIRSKFTQSNPVDILGIAKYYYDSNRGDIVVIEGGKEITLDVASSGLQSVVPLLVSLTYGSEWIFFNEQDTSFDKYFQIQKLVLKYFTKDEDDERLEKSLKSKSVSENLDSIISDLKLYNFKEGPENIKDAAVFVKNISIPHFSSFIIEEPEENLFPATQCKLMRRILRFFNNGFDNRLVITTHSPYILYALNNFMLGYVVKDNIPIEDNDYEELKHSWVSPADVSVWEIKDGKFTSDTNSANGTIQDEEGLIRSNYFDKIMKNIMAEFNNLLNYYD